MRLNVLLHVLLLLVWKCPCVCSSAETVRKSQLHPSAVQEAVEVLDSIGVRDLCHPHSSEYSPYLPLCTDESAWERFLEFEEQEGDEEPTDDLFYVWNGLAALACVTTAALAAGLTMGLMSLDPLILLIKIRAGATEQERMAAKKLLPIVRQHHLLLVSLLLLNSIANEALPLFLEKLVPGYVAVILSVTFVLFFGEIIPSAVFTGPNQIPIASSLTPIVRTVMAILFPIAYPIAKLLDCCLLHDETSSSSFNRGELSALVRIQYEERLAEKRRSRSQRRKTSVTARHPHTDADIDSISDSMLMETLRALKRQLQQQEATVHSSAQSSSRHSTAYAESLPSSLHNNNNNQVQSQFSNERAPSIHLDEVSMVEGALQMKTKVVMDIYKPFRKVFSISYDTVLDETTVVQIYSSGYSRIPVFEPKPNQPKNKTAIRGVLMTKQLIVIDTRDKRELATFPLYTPECVSPKLNLVEMLNLFQSPSASRGGHLALVCARPDLGTAALERGECLPENAGLMGIVTLEDVLEELLQEQIFDEMDRFEQKRIAAAQWAWRKWRLYVKKKKLNREEMALTNQPKLMYVVNQAVADSRQHPAVSNDATPLLQTTQDNEKPSGFFSFFS